MSRVNRIHGEVQGSAGTAEQVPQRPGLRLGDPVDGGWGEALLPGGVPVSVQRDLEPALWPGVPVGARARTLSLGLCAEHAHLAPAHRLLLHREREFQLRVAQRIDVLADQPGRRARAPHLGGGGAARGLLLPVCCQRERAYGEVSMRKPRQQLRYQTTEGSLQRTGGGDAGHPESAQGSVSGEYGNNMERERRHSSRSWRCRGQNSAPGLVPSALFFSVLSRWAANTQAR